MTHKKTELQTVQEEVEVVELFDENGDSKVFELLSTIEHEKHNYLVLTPFVEDESKINLEVPAEVFVMQEIIKDGDKMLEPVADEELVKEIFDIFKDDSKEKYDFATDESIDKIQEHNGNSKQPMIEKEKNVLTNTAHSSLSEQVEQVISPEIKEERVLDSSDTLFSKYKKNKEEKSNRPKYEDDLDYLIQGVDIFEKELEAIIAQADGIINNTSKFERIFNMCKRKKLVEAYLKKVQCLQKLNKYKESEKVINELLKLNPNMPEALVRLGGCYTGKDNEKSIEYISKALNNNSDYPYAYFSRAFTYGYNMGQYDSAIKDMTTAVEKKPDYAWAFWYRGDMYNYNNEKDKTIEDCKKALSINPRCTDAYYTWKNALDYLKSKENFDYESARKDFFAAYSKLNIYEQLHISAFKTDEPDFEQAVNTYFRHWKDTSKAEKYLLMSMLEYLQIEAPDDEQNLFMVVHLIDAGIDDRKNTNDDYESDLDRLFNMLEEKNEDHIALKHYKKFKELAGSTSNEQKVYYTCRQHFPVIGNWKNIFKYARNKNDVEMLAVLIMRTFGTYAIDRGIDLNPEVIEFANYLKDKYEKFNELELPMRYYDFDFQSKEIDYFKEFERGCGYENFTEELSNFPFLLPPQKRERLNKAEIMASLAQVMARNLSHNIGSHVFSHLSGEKICSQLEEKIKANTYISIINIDEKFLKPNPQLAYFNQYVKNRMAYLSEVTYGIPSTLASKKMYSEVFRELDRVRLLLNYISGKTEFKYQIQLKYTDKNGTTYKLSKSKDIPAAFPSDITGCQAFYNIIENIIRNTAKHSQISVNNDNNKPITFTINIREIFPDKQNTPLDYQQYYCVEIDDGIQKDNITELVEKMEDFLEKTATDERGNLRREGLGCIEMESSAAFLRQISDVDYEIQKEKERRKFHNLLVDTEPEKQLKDTDIKRKIGGVLDKNEEYVPLLEAFSAETDNKNKALGYRFYIKKPQEFLLVGDWNISNDAKSALLGQGILIKSKRELLGELEKNASFAHRFVISTITEQDFFAEKTITEKTFSEGVIERRTSESKELEYKALLPNRWCYVDGDNINEITNLITASDFDIVSLEAKVWELFLGKSLLDEVLLQNGADIDKMKNIELKEKQIVLIDHSAIKYDDFIKEKQKNPSISTWIEILSSNAQNKLPFFYLADDLSEYRTNVNQSEFDNNNISIIIKGQLWDSYGSRILVIEDRIQTYSKTEITVDNNNFSVDEILLNSGVFITKENLNKSSLDVGNLIPNINKEIDTVKPKFVLIHYSILESVYGNYYNNRKKIDECLRNWVEDKGCIVVVTSGRGRHTIQLPPYIRFLNMSSVSYAFMENRNKYSMNYILNQARR